MKNIGSMTSQNFRNDQFWDFFLKNEETFKFIEQIKKWKTYCEGRKGQSTSPPSGNLVDGLPLACHTRAVVYEIKMGATKNDTPPPENGRGVNVLLDDLAKKPQKTLWHVSWRFTGS